MRFLKSALIAAALFVLPLAAYADAPSIELRGTHPIIMADQPIVLAQADVAPAAAPDTVIHTGDTINDLLKAYATIIGTVLAAIVGWAQYKITGIRQDAEARDAIEKFVNNAAGGFVIQYTSEALQKMNIDTGNAEIAGLTNAALTRIPDALARFKLGPGDLRQRIVEKIGLATAGLPPATTPAALMMPEPAASGAVNLGG